MKIVIIGGGITGLSAAWYAQKKYPEASIILFEKQNRLGGSIQTSYDGGYLFEKGPRTFQINRSPHLLELIRELDLQIIESSQEAKRRFILYKGKLRTPTSLLPRFFPTLIRELFIPRSNQEDESICDFASRRFSAKMAEVFFDPLTLGIYAGDIRKLSLRSCFPSLHQWEKEHGSVVKALMKLPKAKKGLFTIKGGMQRLIDALEQKLKIEIHLNTEVDKVSADLVIDATPPKVSKKSLWIVNLVYPNQKFTKKGFGYLIPTQYKQAALGVIFDSVIFPQQNRSDEMRFSVMLREETKEPMKSAKETLKQHLGIKTEPIYKQAFFAEKAIPQFEVGCGQRVNISVDGCIEKAMNIFREKS